MDNLPWHTWARQGYQGCISDVEVDNAAVNLRKLTEAQVGV